MYVKTKSVSHQEVNQLMMRNITSNLVELLLNYMKTYSPNT